MNSPAPRLSVIIPAYRSLLTIAQCLEGLRDQVYRDFEVLVVNSSPERELAQVVERFPGVHLIQRAGRLLPHAARNLGAQQARGAWLVFTDPDCRPDAHWLERLMEAQDHGRDPVGGSLGCGDRRWLHRGAHWCKFSWALPELQEGPMWILPTASLCCSRRLWEQIGPFRGDLFAADALFSWRARSAGQTPWFVPRARVDHLHLPSLPSLWRERHQRGREFARIRSDYEQWGRLRAGLYAFAFPLPVLWTLLRSGRHAIRAGNLRSYFSTLPVQAWGQLAWCLGEWREHWRTAAGRPAIPLNWE